MKKILGLALLIVTITSCNKQVELTGTWRMTLMALETDTIYDSTEASHLEAFIQNNMYLETEDPQELETVLEQINHQCEQTRIEFKEDKTYTRYIYFDGPEDGPDIEDASYTLDEKSIILNYYENEPEVMTISDNGKLIKTELYILNDYIYLTFEKN